MKALYDNTDKCADALKEYVQEDNKFKKIWSRVGKRNVAYANGDQQANSNNFSNSNETQIFQNQFVMSKDNAIAGYLTNEISPIVRTLGSFLCGNKPTVDVEADSENDEQSEQIAKVGGKINDALYDIDDEYYNSSQSAFWAMSVGSVFSKDYWDPLKGDFQTVNPQTGEPEGENSVAILTPFQMLCDNSITDFKKQIVVGDQYLMDIEWAREVYDRNDQGFTGRSGEIDQSVEYDEVIRHYESMKMSVPYVGQKNKPRNKDKCLIQEFYIKPNQQFPKGRMFIKAGGIPVFDSLPDFGSPYFMEFEPTMWHPYCHFYWEQYVGRLLGKSLVEQLVPLQMRINEINAAIVQNANTLGKPNILAPKGCLEKGVWNGGGYTLYLYNEVPNGQPPQFLTGTPLPAQFFNERQMLIEEMVRIAGTNFVMQGQAPTGVTAASAIQQLLENANSQQSDLSNRWHNFHQERMTKKLRLIHKFNRIPNQQLNAKLKRITRGCLDVQIQNFIGVQDLSNGIYCKIEDGSMLAKSESAKRSGYVELLKEGGVSPAIAEDSPRGNKLRAELSEKMGLEPLDIEESVEVKKSDWENQKMLIGQPVNVDPLDDNQTHIYVHTCEYQKPEFQENSSPETKQLFVQHIQMHQQAEQQKQLQAQQQQMMQQQMIAAQQTQQPMPQHNLPMPMPQNQAAPVQ